MSQLQSCSSRSSSSSLLLPRQAQTATLRPVCAAATTTTSRRRGIISRAAVSRSCRSRALVVRPQAIFDLYRENANRAVRATELLTQCVEFQARMFKAKDELETAAKEANDAIYEAYRKVEPDTTTPEGAEDWNRKIKLSDREVREFKIDNWVVDMGGTVAALFVGKRVYKYLQPVLETANCFKAAGQAVEQAAIEAATEVLSLSGSQTSAELAAERVSQDLARRAAPEMLEVAGVEASEVAVSTTTRAITGVSLVSGAAAFVGGVVVFILSDLIAESITGAIRRDRLRGIIRKAYTARLNLKLLDMKYQQLREELATVVIAFNFESSKENSATVTKEKLDEIAKRVLEQHASKLDAITPEAAAAALADLDRRMSSWTEED